MKWSKLLVGLFIKVVFANYDHNNFLRNNQEISENGEMCPLQNFQLNAIEFMNNEGYTASEIENFINNFNGIEILDTNPINDQMNGERQKRTLTTVCVKVKSKKRSEEPMVFCKKVPKTNINTNNGFHDISMFEGGTKADLYSSNLNENAYQNYQHPPSGIPSNNNAENEQNVQKGHENIFDTYKPAKPLIGKFPNYGIVDEKYYNQFENSQNSNNNFEEKKIPIITKKPVEDEDILSYYEVDNDNENVEKENPQKQYHQQTLVPTKDKKPLPLYPIYSAGYQALTAFDENAKQKYSGVTHNTSPPVEVPTYQSNGNINNQNTVEENSDDFVASPNPTYLQQKPVEALKLINNKVYPYNEGIPYGSQYGMGSYNEDPNLQSINYAHVLNHNNQNAGRNWYGNVEGNFQFHGSKPSFPYSNNNFRPGFNHFNDGGFNKYQYNKYSSNRYEPHTNHYLKKFEKFLNKMSNYLPSGFRSEDSLSERHYPGAQPAKHHNLGFNAPVNHDYYKPQMPVPSKYYNPAIPQYIPNKHHDDEDGNIEADSTSGSSCSNSFVVNCEPLVSYKSCNDDSLINVHESNIHGYHKQPYHKIQHYSGQKYGYREGQNSAQGKHIQQHQQRNSLQEQSSGTVNNGQNSQNQRKVLKTVKTVYVTQGDKTIAKSGPSIQTTSSSTVSEATARHPIEQQRTIIKTQTSHTSSDKADVAKGESSKKIIFPGNIAHTDKEGSGSTIKETLSIPNFNTSPFHNRYSTKFSQITKGGQSDNAGNEDNVDENHNVSDNEKKENNSEHSERKARTINDNEYFSTIDESAGNLNSNIDIDNDHFTSDDKKVIYDFLTKKL